MKIVIVKSGLVILLFEIENTDSLLSDAPIGFINIIITFRTKYYFVDITATVISDCIILIEGKLTTAVWAGAAQEGMSIPMLFYLNHSSSSF